MERTHVPAVLRALLTAIFFHRRLDNLDPETIDVLETHVASAGEGGSGEIARQVQGKIDEFSARFIDAGADSGEVSDESSPIRI